MDVALIILLAYVFLVVVACIQIVLTTDSAPKALAYILFAIFIPVIGISFYLIFGLNYWKKRKYDGKMLEDVKILKQVKSEIEHYNGTNLLREDEAMTHHVELASMLVRDLKSPLTMGNKVKLLNNGEQKFPELLKEIKAARHHIHLEYYIFRCDTIGMKIIEVLIEKAREGVEVRLIYDDFGSPTIKGATKRRLEKAGAEVFPFHKVRLYLLANRFNYRNHRKIVVIDGQTAFVGGINVSDNYLNNGEDKTYWRDTHLYIRGPAVYYLQYLFMSDWKFSCSNPIDPTLDYFSPPKLKESGHLVQIAASGPDAKLPSVLFSILQVIYLAEKEILITTPYFIPGESCMDALAVAALSGLSVKLLVPSNSDSMLVDAAARSYYAKLLDAGVEIYLYQKGMVHAKTIVTDAQLAVVGTANMDYRSFELNFEVNVIVYDADFAEEMRQVFFEDLKDSEQIDKEDWLSRPWTKRLPENTARLFSPVL